MWCLSLASTEDYLFVGDRTVGGAARLVINLVL